MVLFTASKVDVEQMDDLNAFVIAFAEREDGTGRRLELQRSLQHDDQDAALGMDTYCLCNSDGASCYGGIAEWSIDSGGLDLTLHQNAASTLGVPVKFRVGFLLPEGGLLRLGASLRRVIDDVDA